MTAQRIVVAVMAAATSALSIGLLSRPWDGVVVVAVAGLGTLYETPKPPTGGVA